MTTTADTTATTTPDATPPEVDTATPDSADNAPARKPVAPHTDVPAPLAGPARRAALALGVPGIGLAELLAHANFGWAGVAAVSAAAVVGAGAVYAVRRQREAKAADTGSKVGASKTPSSLAFRLRAKPDGHSHTRGDGVGGRGLASRVMSRFGGRGGRGAGGALGGGGGLGGRSRGVAGRSGSRAGLGMAGHGGRNDGRAGKARSAPGARTAAAKAAQLMGGRAPKTPAGLRSLANRSHHRKGDRSGFGGGLGGGSFFGSGGSRNPAPSRDRRRDSHGHGGRGGRPHTTPGRGQHDGDRGGRLRSWRLRIPLRRPRMRTLAVVAGGLTLGVLAVPAVMAATALAGVAGAFRLASSPRVRYGASVIAGWTRLRISRVFQWARAQWWKARGKTVTPEPYTFEGEPVDEPHTSTSPPKAPPVVEDAEIIDPDSFDVSTRPLPPRAPVLEGHKPPAPAAPRASLPPTRPRTQPALAPSQPVPSTPTLTEEPISMSMLPIIETVISADTFVPADGPDTQAHLHGYVKALRALAAKFDSDMNSISATIPAFQESLQSLDGMGSALSEFANQAENAFAAWKESAAWVWQNQES